MYHLSGVRLIKAQNTKLDWVVAQLRPNMLSKACRHIENQNFEVFAPTRFETTKTSKKFRRTQKLLFPGYVFIRCDVNSNDVSALKATVGVSRVVRGIGGGPGVIPNLFIEELKRASRLGSSEAISLKNGDKVRLIDGPFVGMVGEIMSADTNGRLRVLFDLMSGVRPTWVKLNSIEISRK